MPQEEEFKEALYHIRQCEWVMDEFRGSLIGDRRLSRRLLVVARHFAQHPEAPINQASENWCKTKAAYRFFDNRKVTDQRVLARHYQRTAQRIASQTDDVLVVQDTTFLNYSHMQCSTDLGPIGQLSDGCMGLVMHTSLALTPRGLPLGVLDQGLWVRSVDEHGKSENRAKLRIEDKESYKWLKALKRYTQRTSGNIITICDTEADIYDLFSEATKLEAKFLVRAKYDRRTENEVKLQRFIAGLEVAATDSLTLPRQADRAGRQATVEIRFGYTKFLCPPDRARGEKLPALSLYVMAVQEVSPPEGVEPVSWILLTNVPTKTLSQVRKRISWYKRRWSIEMFHRILKSGCKVERARLEKNQRRFPYLALYSIIAWNLLLLTHYSRVDPTAPATDLLSRTECQVLHAVTHNELTKNHSFSAKKAVGWLAQLGGYLARRRDPAPGPTHLWRGWQRLQDFTSMYALVTRK